MEEQTKAPEGYEWVDGILKQKQATGSDQSHPNPAPVDLSALTDDDLRREAKESLVLMMRGAKGDLKALGAVRELLDRIEGKPIARTEASLDVRSVSLEVKAYNARNELLDKILKSGNK